MAEPEWQTEEAWMVKPEWLTGEEMPVREVFHERGEAYYWWGGSKLPLTDEVYRAMGYRKMRRQFKATEWEEVPADG